MTPIITKEDALAMVNKGEIDAVIIIQKKFLVSCHRVYYGVV